MKPSIFRTIIVGLLLLVFISCKKEKLFVDPTFEIIAYSLVEFPGDTIYLEIDVQITNNDDREVHIDKISYQVTVEGITSSLEEVEVNQAFLTDTPLKLTLPISVETNDALELFSQVELGEELAYQVSGTIRFDDPILRLFDIPINVEGTAVVDVGYEAFYEEPEIRITDIAVDYTLNNWTSYEFDFIVSLAVVNHNPFTVTFDEITYTVGLENLESDLSKYSDLNSEPFILEANSTGELLLPIHFNLDLIDGLELINNITDGSISYHIEGSIDIAEINGVALVLTMPFLLDGDF